ncbi:hypothetical protein [Nocardioides sp. SYSU DS0663]
MTTAVIAAVALGWVLLSIPIAIAVGRAFRAGQQAETREQRAAREDREAG